MEKALDRIKGFFDSLHGIQSEWTYKNPGFFATYGNVKYWIYMDSADESITVESDVYYPDGEGNWCIDAGKAYCFDLNGNRESD